MVSTYPPGAPPAPTPAIPPGLAPPCAAAVLTRIEHSFVYVRRFHDRKHNIEHIIHTKKASLSEGTTEQDPSQPIEASSATFDSIDTTYPTLKRDPCLCCVYTCVWRVLVTGLGGRVR